MQTVLPAVAPVFALILAGLAFKHWEFPAPGFWPQAERLTYYILLPALFIKGLSGHDTKPEFLLLGLILALAVLSVVVLLSVLRPLLCVDGPEFTSILQGAIRPNSYVALFLAEALLGTDWPALSAAALLTLVPLVNILAVSCLIRHGAGRRPGRSAAFKAVAGNPLILACVVGLTMNALDLSLPSVLDRALQAAGQAALPMGLLAVGAGLRPSGLTRHIRPALSASALHLLLLPAVAAALSHLLQAPDSIRTTALIFTAVPVSVSSFILARQMGGDHEAMASIITLQTALALASLPLVLLLQA
jgi:hypothetical protein